MSGIIFLIIAVLLVIYFRNNAPQKGKPVNFRSTRKIGELSVDERNNLFRIKSARFKTFDFQDVIKYELKEDGQSITSGGLSIGRAIVGSAINPMGTLLGGLTGNRKSKDVTTNMEVAITVRGENQGLYKINIIDSKIKKSSKEYKRKVAEAEEIIALFDIALD